LSSRIDRYQYQLSSSQGRQLVEILARLIKEDYSWRDLYTQCVIGNVLLAFQLGQDYNPYYCDDGSIPRRGIVHKHKNRLAIQHLLEPDDQSSLFPLVPEDGEVPDSTASHYRSVVTKEILETMSLSKLMFDLFGF